MQTVKYRGLSISFRINEEPPGVFWPNGDIQDPETGEMHPVSVPKHAYSEREAIEIAARVAVHRIRNGTWRG